MDLSKSYFSSRLSSRAVVGATLSTYALMVLAMVFAAGVGAWNLRVTELPMLGTGFWVWACLAWAASLFVSSYVGAIASRSITTRDGALHGFVIWASACVFGCLILAASTNVFHTEMNPGVYWASFIGDVLALAAAVYGGILGADSEAKAEVTEIKRLEERAAPLKQAV